MPPHSLRDNTSLMSIRIFCPILLHADGPVSPKMLSVHLLVVVISYFLLITSNSVHDSCDAKQKY